MTGKLIVIEGLDFVGKTTLAKEIAKKVSGIVYKTPPKEYIKKIILFEGGNVVFSEKRFFLFMNSMRTAFREVDELIKTGNIVIADRWIWTTLAYHFASNEILHSVWKEKWKTIIPEFHQSDLSILLHVNDSKIISERAHFRETLSPSDELLINNKSLQEKIFNLYQSLNLNFTLINNSSDIQQSVQQVLSLLE